MIPQIMDIMEENGGRTWARTKDPLIKSVFFVHMCPEMSAPNVTMRLCPDLFGCSIAHV